MSQSRAKTITVFSWKCDWFFVVFYASSSIYHQFRSNYLEISSSFCILHVEQSRKGLKRCQKGNDFLRIWRLTLHFGQRVATDVYVFLWISSFFSAFNSLLFMILLCVWSLVIFWDLCCRKKRIKWFVVEWQRSQWTECMAKMDRVLISNDVQYDLSGSSWPFKKIALHFHLTKMSCNRRDSIHDGEESQLTKQRS